MPAIKPKTSSTAGVAPPASALVVGEIAVNTADSLLFTKHTDNSVKTIGAKPTDAETKTAYENNSDTNAFTDAEKSKLAGVEASATADQTDAEILAAVKNGDGTGSGLDADKLDGQEGAYYTTYADNAVSALVDSSPTALNTLNELAAALGDDASFSTTVTNSIATKLPLAGGTMTGDIVLSGSASIDGRNLSVDGTKLDGIETGATADQAADEIKTLYEQNSDTNAFTDAEKTKLNGITAGATPTNTTNVVAALTAGSNITINSDGTISSSGGGAGGGDVNQNAFSNFAVSGQTSIAADQTTDIVNLVGGANVTITTNAVTDTITFTSQDTTYNVGDGGLTQKNFTTALNTKLTNIEAGATADQTASEIEAIVNHDNLQGFVANEHIDWSAASAGTINPSNYVDNDTTYSVGDGGLTQNNFTNTLKTKLDNIEANATIDQTPAELLTAIKTVHGATSGLDADKLDGFEGSYYTAYADNAVTALVDSAPATLNTLNELAAALGDDANFSTTLTTNLGSKLSLTGGTVTGDILMSGTSTVDGRDLSVDGAKLDLIEANATADQTAAEIQAIVSHDNLQGVNANQHIDWTSADAGTIHATNYINTTYTVQDGQLSQNNFTNALKTKLDGIEASADVVSTSSVVGVLTAGTNVTIAADGTISSSGGGGGSGETNQNAFSNFGVSGQTTVAADTATDTVNFAAGSNITITTNATTDTITIAATDTNTTYSVQDGELSQNNFTTALKSKLNGIEAAATADQTASEIEAIVSHDNLQGFVAAEHIDWSTSQSSNIHASNYTDTTYNVGDGGLTQNNFTTTLKTKLDSIEANATSDQTASEIEGIVNHDNLQGFVSNEHIDWTASGAGVIHASNYTDTDTTYTVGDAGLTEKNFTTALNTKLAGIEAAATADQTDAEIKTAYENNSNTNVFTDTEKSKLTGIEASATADQTAAEIEAIVSHNNLQGIVANQHIDWTASGAGTIHASNYTDTDTTYTVGDNGLTEKNFTTALNTKLAGIEASADITDTANVVAALTAGSNITIASDGTISSSGGGGGGGSQNVFSSLAVSGQTNITADSTTDTLTLAAGSNVTITTNASTDTVTVAATDTTYSVGDGGLTQKNFTTALNTKLTGIETAADVTDTVNVVAALTAGANVTIAADGTIAATDTDTTYVAATTSAAGLMSAADKTKLDGVETAADVTDTANVVAALSAGSNIAIAANGTISATDTDTTYSVGDGGLTQKNFTTALNTKLTGIEANATADQTAAEILTAIKTVDGAASGLDADKLDGQEGSYYTAYADTAVSNLVDSSPAALNTLNELASALGDDANFSTTVTNSIATKLALSGGTMTGDIVMSATETVDGRDVSVDGAKLDGIEAGAQVTNTTRVVAALTAGTNVNIAADGTISSTYAAPTSTATPSVNGLMSAADKTKLNAIETGATADQTASEIEGIVSHDNLIGFVANEHIDWSASAAGTIHSTNYTDTTYSVGDGGLTQKNFTTALNTKLAGIEAAATADQTASEIEAIVNHDNLQGFVAAEHIDWSTSQSSNIHSGNYTNTTYSVQDGELSQKNFTATLKTKLDGIEAAADITDTANVVSALTAGTNVNITAGGVISSTYAAPTSTATSSANGLMSTTDKVKLDAIEASATADQTDAEIKTGYENNSNTNAFTDSEKTKLSGIEASATADQTASEIEAIVNHDNLQGFVAAEHIDWSTSQSSNIHSGNYTDTTYSVQDGELSQKNFTTTLKTKLDGIEAAADVTDSANVVAALTAGTGISIAANGTIASTATGTSYQEVTITVANGNLAIDGTENQTLTLIPSVTYRLNNSDNSNSNHPILLATSADGTTYTLGVTTVGTAGQSGAYVQVKLEQDAPTLFYKCGNHSGMGGSVSKGGTTYTVGDGGLTQNNFTNADHTKLDAIEAGAQLTNTARVVAALTAGTNITIASDGTIASTAAASGGTNYASTSYTATANQTTFNASSSPALPAYTAGRIAVFSNGVKLEAAAFSATNGTSVVLGAGATANDLIEIVDHGSGAVNLPSAMGTAGQYIKVNSGANGLEFDTLPAAGITAGRSIAMSMVFGG